MKALMIVAAMAMAGCSAGNLEEVKERGPERWRDMGYEVVAYEGYQWGFWGFNEYGGAKVWWRVSVPGKDIVYSGYLQKWGDELHVYGPRAIDAIAP